MIERLYLTFHFFVYLMCLPFNILPNNVPAVSVLVFLPFPFPPLPPSAY